MDVLNKKERKINLLKRDITKLNNNIMKIENKHKTVVDNLTIQAQGYQTQITFLTEQLNKSELKLEEKNVENGKVQTTLQQQIRHRYLAELNICGMLEKSHSNNIDLLINAEKLVNPNIMQLIEEKKQTLMKFSQEIEEAKTVLNTFYNGLENNAFNDISNLTLDRWPKIPNISLNINDVLLPNLNRPVETIKEMKNQIKTLKNKPRSADYDINRPLTSGTITGTEISACNQTLLENNLNSPETTQFPDSTSQNSDNLFSGFSSLRSYVQHNLDKALLEYLQTELNDVEKSLLLSIIFKMRDENDGTLAGLDRKKLVRDIRNKLNSEPKKEPNIENECIICLSVLNKNDTHVLKCKHHFHKACIKDWLKEQRVCPMCPVHVSSLEEPGFEESCLEERCFEESCFEGPCFEEHCFEEHCFEEPCFEEHCFEEHCFEEPSFEEPCFDKPCFEEHCFEEPCFEDHCFEEHCFEEHCFEEPCFGEPCFEEPGFEESCFDEPCFGQPGFEEPCFEEPGFEEPCFEEPCFGEPGFEEPCFEEPCFEEPCFEEHCFEEPYFEESCFEESYYEEPYFE